MTISGIGIGFRREISDQLLAVAGCQMAPAFVECAPENWIGVGGRWGKTLRAISEAYPLTCHGLSLSIGGPDPLDFNLLGRIKQFLQQHQVSIYSEHLSYSTVGNAHLHELLPIPFRTDAVKRIIMRLKVIQDFLGHKLAIENVSYYTPVAAEMSEADFIRSILEGADCELLLDVNNVYVNAFNHSYCPRKFLAELPLERVRYLHMAGHERRSEELIIDTHGQPIVEDVYELFAYACSLLPEAKPVLLERDYNFEDFEELIHECSRLQAITITEWGPKHVTKY